MLLAVVPVFAPDRPVESNFPFQGQVLPIKIQSAYYPHIGSCEIRFGATVMLITVYVRAVWTTISTKSIWRLSGVQMFVDAVHVIKT